MCQLSVILLVFFSEKKGQVTGKGALNLVELDPDSAEAQAYVFSWLGYLVGPEYGTQFREGSFLRRFFSAGYQGADHDVSTDWLAACPRGHKNPRPCNESSSTFLFVACPVSRLVR